MTAATLRAMSSTTACNQHPNKLQSGFSVTVIATQERLHTNDIRARNDWRCRLKRLNQANEQYIFCYWGKPT